MVSLQNQKDFRSVQRLPFCYLCGRSFVAGDNINRDHLPAKSLFAKQHREPLWLPTHTACNKSHELVDEKIGQLIGLRQGRRPNSTMRRLQFDVTANGMAGAVRNLDIDSAVWRWIAGFHAAPYRTSPVGIRGSLVTPFPRGRNTNGRIIFEPLRPQHQVFVRTLQQNRAKGTLDRIICNKPMVVYECVWCQSDSGPWLCIFGLDVCDWKDLGRTGFLRARGCAGFYVLPYQSAPTGATKGTTSSIVIPMSDPLDPFNRQ
jgi:hypothetical protein